MTSIRILILFALFVLFGCQFSYAEVLPVCSNRIINLVTKRSGCTVGDSKCWLVKGGFCTDYIEKMTMSKQSQKQKQLQPITPENVRKGDVAQFLSRAHYSLVESVNKDKSGKPVAVNVSEYNYGSCWVDQDLMVTDKYKIVNKRVGIPLQSVDGGFLRP